MAGFSLSELPFDALQIGPSNADDAGRTADAFVHDARAALI